MRTQLRVGVVATVLLGTAALAPTPAFADAHPPRLTFAELRSSTNLTADSMVTIAWSAEDDAEPGSGVESAAFGYENVDDAGRVLADLTVYGAYAPGPDGRMLANATLEHWAAAGHYRLTFIGLTDKIGNPTTYYRDGSVKTRETLTAPPPAPVDFTALDFDVTNPNADIGAPTIANLKPVSRNVLAGEPIVLASQFTDDRSGPKNVTVVYVAPSGGAQVFTDSDPALAAAGLTSGLLPLGAEGGRWRAVQVGIADRAGNVVEYGRDGTHPMFRPTGITTYQAQAPIDWAALDIDVTPLTPDTDPPMLSAISREGTAQLHRGDDIVMHYAVRDANRVKFVLFDFEDVTGHHFGVMNQCLPESGTAVLPVPFGLDPGRVRLIDVQTVDDLLNQRVYNRDGTVWTTGSAGGTPPGIDLTPFDFELTDGPASFTGHASTEALCPRIPKLPITLPPVAAPGEVIDVLGQVLSAADQVISGAEVALFATVDGASPELLDVVSADGEGRYRTTATITKDTTYQVRFLGRSGSAGADATTSEPRLVHVDPNATPRPRPSSSGGPAASPAAPASTRPSGSASPDSPATPTLSFPTLATYGSSIPVAAHGTPGRALEVWAYSRPSTTYRLVRTGTFDSAGSWTTTVRPATNTRLFVKALGSTGWMSSVTRAVQIKTAVSLRVSALSSTGRRTFAGNAGPALTGRLVSIYRSGTTGPQLFAQVRTTSTGAFTLTAASPRGSYVFDARTAATDRNAAGISPGVYTS